MQLTVTLEQDEDGFIVAHCPALPGCHSQGRTEEEALTNIREAIVACLLTLNKYSFYPSGGADPPRKWEVPRAVHE